MRYRQQDAPPAVLWTYGSYPAEWKTYTDTTPPLDEQLFSGLHAQSMAMQHCLTAVKHAAQHMHPVWLLGERGTGRQMLAHCMHLAGTRRHGTFIRLRCRDMSSAELQREILGGIQHPSVIQRAQTGTLYIEDAEYLSPWEHALLADLMSERLHGAGHRPHMPRIILSSGIDLRERMTDWYWLQQLFHTTVPRPLYVPSLRDRAADLLPLATRMLAGIQSSDGIGAQYVRGFSPVAERWISLQNWAGNLVEMRECLRHALERYHHSDTREPWLELEHFAPAKQPFKRLLKRMPQRWMR